MKMNRRQRWTADAIPDQSGRTVVVTGANSGIGYEIAAALARRGARTVLAVRDIGAGTEAAARIADSQLGATVSVQQLDLASMRSVRSAAAELRASYPRIDLLINNAGLVAFTKGSTEEGFELHFGVCHLGHFALTGLLLDMLMNTPGARIVTVSSFGHRMAGNGIDFADPHWQRRPYKWVHAYGQAKLANLLFTYELQRRLAAASGTHAIAVAAHPGTTKTQLVRDAPISIRLQNRLLGSLRQGAAMGALPILRAATDPAVVGGQYFGPRGLGELRGHPRIVSSSATSRNALLQRRLWEMSEDLTGVRYSV
ncbi:oxidoreductase [Nocardia nova]|uniref:oxidoreductase n=1 Tax=Nocardia nova TaxID=37330 RepID=UPI001895E8B6|nr:oxidoreductase [Nocardia nova]MBF6150373.1 SDR family NAD(P)-dependent oxidoreductase [Nocardia nova]MDN2496058.1 SDR family NAD(P)-dependent oxidoreductase [Nocardia nova]